LSFNNGGTSGTGVQPLLLGGVSVPSPPASHREISIPTVAQKYGLRYSPAVACRIGRLAAHLYRKRHDNVEPPKRTVLFQGRPVNENAYFDDDEDIVRYAIMTHLNVRDENEYNALRSSITDLLP
jgi:hypothetical protein